MINADPITTKIAEIMSLKVIFSNPPNKKYAKKRVNNGAMLIRGINVTIFPILKA
jgi:hypothetical protein